MSTKRRESATSKKAPDGTVLCSCGCGNRPPKGRRTWFSDECVKTWKIKNDPGYVRMLLAERDKGICAQCGCDSEAEYRKWRAGLKEASRFVESLYHNDRSFEWDERAHHWRFVPDDPNRDWKAISRRRRELLAKWSPPGDWTAGRTTGWDADHIHEVVRGGGQCGLENYQTLCHPCHKAKTRRLAAERAHERRQVTQPTLSI
jgi:hypothetical protein